MNRIGYARVSTEEQNLDLQIQALRAAGCDSIFKDKGISGAARQRPGLDKAIRRAKPGDTLVVWKLDRFGRSLSHLVDLLAMLREKGVAFCSLQEQIDTNSAGGRFYLHILGALAEFEREMISERTRAGMAAARKRGKKIGRPRCLSRAKVILADKMIRNGQSRRAVAAALGVDVVTLRRSLQAANLNPPRAPRRVRNASGILVPSSKMQKRSAKTKP